MSDFPIALITGSSSGLGWHVAAALLKEGYRVVLLGRDASRLEVACQRLIELDSGSSSQVDSVTCDVGKDEAVDELHRVVLQRYGRLDVLVNNVGESDRGTVVSLTPERLRVLTEMNVLTTLRCSVAMLPLLEESGGVVINIGSLAARVGARHLGGYCAAKHALAGLTQQMRLEWRSKGVHVGLLNPGPIRREDAGNRYDNLVQQDTDLPDSAKRPGGGTKVKGLPPARVADAVVKMVRRRIPDVVLPGYLRWLIAIGHVSPRLGDWLLLRFTS